jgi:hypothetical protein
MYHPESSSVSQNIPTRSAAEPVYDSQHRITGYRRMIYEPEAKVVRRIFRLYVGDEGGKPHSGRQIAIRLNEEGIPPPGARWRNRTKRQGTTWSFTAIIGHRRLKKGLLNNVNYIGKLVCGTEADGCAIRIRRRTLIGCDQPMSGSKWAHPTSASCPRTCGTGSRLGWR